ncbi:MAG: hypothetical protein U9R79_01950 [Armatimonadota bacterium]|nr:hypothetical protein [Armatimonadota bacterium]
MTLRNRRMKRLTVACIAFTIILGIGAVAAVTAEEAAGQEQRLINIDVRDMEISDVLRMLGKAANVNIIVGHGVAGEIETLTLHDVSVERALRLITESEGYHWRQDDNVYVVSAEPPAVEEEQVEPATEVEPQVATANRQAPEDETVTPTAIVPPPPEEDYATQPPMPSEQPKIITELMELRYATASEVAALFGGAPAPSSTLLRSRGAGVYPSGGSYSSLGRFETYTGGSRLGPHGLAQFGEDVGGAGGRGVTGGGLGGGLTGTGARATTTGAGGRGVGAGGTITLPGEMEPPVAIMSHNALLVRGTREELDQFREMLALLDMPQKQVEISTKWIDVSTKASKALGIDWAVTNGALEIFNLGFAPGEAANNGVRYGRGRWWAELAVLQNNSQATVINEPRVTCMNGMPGMIAFETEIPYFAATISYNQFGQRTVDFTSEFVDVANELWVVPQINPDDSIKMQLSPQLQDQVGTVEGPNGERIPIVTTQYVETMVRVKDGETIVLGGVIRKDESINLRSTPLLSEIPIIGKLFQARRTEINDTELLIFVTPKIVRDQATT